MEQLKFVLRSFIFLVVLFGCVQNQQEKKSEYQDKSTDNYALEELEAYNHATRLVLEKLQEPKTAQFPSTQERIKHIRNLGGKKFRIDSWVDSQDTYGAMTRRRFSLIFQIDSTTIIKEILKIAEEGEIPEVRYHRNRRE